MHTDMLLLAERLVIAMERMSEDVKNISAYMYDLSYSVSYFLRDKNEKDEEENLPSCPPTAGQVGSAEIPYSGHFGQVDNDLEHEETSMGDDQNENADGLSLFTGGTHIGSEGTGESSGLCNILDDGRSYMKEAPFCYLKQEQQDNFDTSVTPRAMSQGEIHPCAEVALSENEGSISNNSEFFNENNRQLHTHQWAKKCSSQTSSSSNRPPTVEMTAMNTEEQLSRSSISSQCKTVLLPSPQYQIPFSFASVSTAHVSVDQERSVEQMIAGDRQKQYSDHSESRSTTNEEKIRVQRERLQSNSSRSLTEERRFECNHCGKALKTKLSFRNHMRTHTGEKPYKCSQCEKSFTNHNSLTLHKRQHSGDRPYKCTVCGKSYKQSSDLTVHMRKHTGDHPYKCFQCGKSFTTNSHLTVHIRIHTGERPYRCTVCGECFKSLGHLYYHKQRFHPAAT